jgi:hypothetical protein
MKLIIYHGSDNIIDNPSHEGGRKFSDFGIGFYATTNIEMAKSWATRRKDKPAYVNKYMFNVDGLNSLTFDLDIHWILFIAYNRGLILNKEIKDVLNKKYDDINKYDVIIGPTADDRMFDTLNLFFNNNITIDHCINALNSMDLDIQYNIRTKTGIDAIAFSSSMELDELDKVYYSNEVKAKRDIMNKKMTFIRQKFGKVGKYFDELEGGDING